MPNQSIRRIVVRSTSKTDEIVSAHSASLNGRIDDVTCTKHGRAHLNAMFKIAACLDPRTMTVAGDWTNQAGSLLMQHSNYHVL